MDILSWLPHLKRLALINLPLWSTAGWSNIEPILPTSLECFAAGPEHAILVDGACYPSLKWFCSVDTVLTDAEFNVLISMPNLRDFHWCFINERMGLECVRGLANILKSRTWNSVCLYVIDGAEMRLEEREELEIELTNLYEDKRVKRYQMVNVEDWSFALFSHWTRIG